MPQEAMTIKEAYESEILEGELFYDHPEHGECEILRMCGFSEEDEEALVLMYIEPPYFYTPLTLPFNTPLIHRINASHVKQLRKK